MKRQTAVKLSLMLVATGAIALVPGCGDEGGTVDPADAIPSANSLAGFSFDCGQGEQAQSKQSPIQQQESCSPQQKQQQQQILYPEGKVADFDVQLDCQDRVIHVRNKGEDQQHKTLGFGSDGKVGGSLNFQQQIADDGKGNQRCWVEYKVTFNGTANCANSGTTSAGGVEGLAAITAQSPSPSPSASASQQPGQTPSPGSSSSPSPSVAGQDQLNLTTTVALEQTNIEALQDAGIDLETTQTSASPSQSPSPSSSEFPGAVPSAEASVSPLVSASPSMSPSPSPSMSVMPSPSGSPSMRPSPSPTVIPVKVCEIDDPCPVQASTDLSCSQ